MDLGAVCAAAATKAATVTGITRAYNYPIPSAQPPFVTCTPGVWSPHQSMGDANGRVPVTVRVVASKADVRSAAVLLYGLMNTSGALISALESDPTLGGTCDSVMVTEVSEPQIYTFGGVDLIGFELTLDVIGS